MFNFRTLILIIMITPAMAYDENLAMLKHDSPCAIDYGAIVIQTYSTDVFYFDTQTNVVRSEGYMGPVNIINPDPGGGGLVVNWTGKSTTGAYLYNRHGQRILDFDALINSLPKEFTGRQGMVHHDFIRTSWGTYMFIYGYWVNESSMDDLIVEVDKNGEILKIVSLGGLLWQDDQNITGLGYWRENWIHTNSLDTRYRGQKKVVLVSLRNLDRLAEIYWDDVTIRRFIGHGILEHAHHARYINRGGEKHILVYNNGVYRERTGIVEFDEYGEYVSEQMTLFYSAALGSVQILPNGNYLITQGGGRVHEIDQYGYVCRTIQYNRPEYTPFVKKETTWIYRAKWVNLFHR